MCNDCHVHVHGHVHVHNVHAHVHVHVHAHVHVHVRARVRAHAHDLYPKCYILIVYKDIFLFFIVSIIVRMNLLIIGY